MSYFRKVEITDGVDDLEVNADGSINIQQNVVVDSNNSSTTPLSAGETFTGTATSTLGIVGLQLSLKTDQNCEIYVEQSPDGTNWDVSDEFDYFYAKGGTGFTVQAVNSYARVRIKNIGENTQTYLRLQLALCPTVEALPRSLTNDRRLKVETHMSDNYDFQAENTPMGELRVASVTKLVGTNFTGTTVDPNFVVVTNANGGTTTQANSQLTLATNTTANGSTVVASNILARYSAGNAMRYRSVIQLGDTGVTNNRRRWGIGWGSTMPTITDGAFFSLEGTTFEISTMKGGVETKVTNGNFNGQLGSTVPVDTNAHTYEIYWTNSKVWFVLGDDILHVVSAPTTTWANTMNMYVGMDNVNSGGLSTNQILYCRVMSISRLGSLLTQPRGRYQSGTTAGIVLKYGPGSLHGIAISGVANNSVVILYDNIAASGTILFSTGTMGSNAVPFEINLHGISFSIGLTLVISGAAANATVMYE